MSLSLILCFSDRQFIERVREMAKGRQRKKNKESETKKNSVSRERERERALKMSNVFASIFQFVRLSVCLRNNVLSLKKQNNFLLCRFIVFTVSLLKAFLM